MWTGKTDIGLKCTCIRFTPDDESVAAGCNNGSVILLGTKDGKAHKVLGAPKRSNRTDLMAGLEEVKGSVMSLKFNPAMPQNVRVANADVTAQHGRTTTRAANRRPYMSVGPLTSPLCARRVSSSSLTSRQGTRRPQTKRSRKRACRTRRSLSTMRRTAAPTRALARTRSSVCTTIGHRSSPSVSQARRPATRAMPTASWRSSTATLTRSGLRASMGRYWRGISATVGRRL